MSGSLSGSVASVSSAVNNASNMLSMIAALTGTPTDLNQGSQVRTLAEALGAITEEQGISDQALALQAFAYGAMSLFGVQQTTATSATGIVTFATSLPVSSAAIAPQAVSIPAGTLFQTAGGVQFTTITPAVLASGTSSINVGAIASLAGAGGNVAAGSITGTPLTAIGYPLFVTNAASMAGGSNAGTQSQALADFTSISQSLGLSSPVAIANAVIGVTSSGTGETVLYGSVYEPWIAAGSGAGSGVAGFTVYIDNGTGSASQSLITAALNFITGSATANQSGFRPAGVPFSVLSNTPVFCTVAVSGLLFPGLLATGAVVPAITSGIQSYFSTIGNYPASAYQPQIAARASDAGLGAFESITVNLFYSGSSTAVPIVTGGIGTRVVLSAITVNIGVGT
jgi:hypothetical protein